MTCFLLSQTIKHYLKNVWIGEGLQTSNFEGTMIFTKPCNDVWKKTVGTAVETESEGHSRTNNTKSTKAFNGASPSQNSHAVKGQCCPSQHCFQNKLCGQKENIIDYQNLSEHILYNCALTHSAHTTISFGTLSLVSQIHEHIMS